MVYMFFRHETTRVKTENKSFPDLQSTGHLTNARCCACCASCASTTAHCRIRMGEVDWMDAAGRSISLVRRYSFRGTIYNISHQGEEENHLLPSSCGIITLDIISSFVEGRSTGYQS